MSLSNADILGRARIIHWGLVGGNKAAAATINPRAVLAIGKFRYGTAGKRFADKIVSAVGRNASDAALAQAITTALKWRGDE